MTHFHKTWTNFSDLTLVIHWVGCFACCLGVWPVAALRSQAALCPPTVAGPAPRRLPLRWRSRSCSREALHGARAAGRSTAPPQRHCLAGRRPAVRRGAPAACGKCGDALLRAARSKFAASPPAANGLAEPPPRVRGSGAAGAGPRLGNREGRRASADRRSGEEPLDSVRR